MSITEREKEILNHTWEIFCSMEESESEDVIKAAAFFVSQYDFDIEVLPEKLQGDVAEALGYEACQDYYDSIFS